MGNILVNENDVRAIRECFAYDSNPPKTLHEIAERMRGLDLSDREKPSCPACKQEFTYKDLDGGRCSCGSMIV